MATVHYVYAIVNPKTNKLLDDEHVWDDRLRAETWKQVFHPKGIVRELILLK